METNRDTGKQMPLIVKGKNIYDANGNIIGYREVDSFDKGRINVYNSQDNKVGHYQKNAFSGNWEYFRD